MWMLTLAGCYASDYVLCLRLGKAAENEPKPLDPAPMWERWKRLLASGWPSSSHCGHLGGDPMDGKSLRPSFLLPLPSSLCTSDFQINKLFWKKKIQLLPKSCFSFKEQFLKKKKKQSLSYNTKPSTYFTKLFSICSLPKIKI